MVYDCAVRAISAEYAVKSSFKNTPVKMGLCESMRMIIGR